MFRSLTVGVRCLVNATWRGQGSCHSPPSSSHHSGITTLAVAAAAAVLLGADEKRPNVRRYCSLSPSFSSCEGADKKTLRHDGVLLKGKSSRLSSAQQQTYENDVVAVSSSQNKMNHHIQNDEDGDETTIDCRTIEHRHLFPSSTNNEKAENDGGNASINNYLNSGSILLIPGVVSPEECRQIREEADHILEKNGGYKRDLIIIETDENRDRDDDEDDDDDNSLRRVSLCDMSQSAQRLSQTIIFSRILPALRQYNHALLDDLGLSRFDDSSSSLSSQLDWAADEPSINRYEAGGRFDPHRDGYALTVIVLLSKSDNDDDGPAFEGGGTRFYESPHAAEENGNKEAGSENNANGTEASPSAVVVRPTQGTAVLFGGDIMHAGCPVTRGARHLYVASFSYRYC